MRNRQISNLDTQFSRDMLYQLVEYQNARIKALEQEISAKDDTIKYLVSDITNLVLKQQQYDY